MTHLIYGRGVRATGLVACVMAFAFTGRAPAAQGADLATTLSLHVELVEQAACALPDGEFLVMVDVRTIYVNHGATPVTLALNTERVTGMTIIPGATLPLDGRNDVAQVAGASGRGSVLPGQVAVMRPGWAQTGSVRAAVRVSGGGRDTAGDALAPGEYHVRFHVEVLAHAGQGTFDPARLSTAAVPVTIESPGQVQECGSAALRRRAFLPGR